MGVDIGIRNITVKIAVEVFLSTLSDLYQILHFIMHLHKCTISVPKIPHISPELELF